MLNGWFLLPLNWPESRTLKLNAYFGETLSPTCAPGSHPTPLPMRTDWLTMQKLDTPFPHFQVSFRFSTENRKQEGSSAFHTGVGAIFLQCLCLDRLEIIFSWKCLKIFLLCLHLAEHFAVLSVSCPQPVLYVVKRGCQFGVTPSERAKCQLFLPTRTLRDFCQSDGPC